MELSLAQFLNQKFYLKQINVPIELNNYSEKYIHEFEPIW